MPIVHCVGLRPPIAGAALMAMAKTLTTLAPFASWIVMRAWYEPVLDGLPVMRTVLPEIAALNPGGSPEALVMCKGPVPPLMMPIPVKPGTPTVHWVVERLPTLRCDWVTVIVKFRVATAPAESVTL